MDFTEVVKSYNPPWSQREVKYFVAAMLVILLVTSILTLCHRIYLTQMIAINAAAIFMCIVYTSTIFTRAESSTACYNLEVFWSWKQIWYMHDRALLKENLLNMILIAPMGLALPFVIHKKARLWLSILSGVLLSGSIELGQLYLHRGLFEFDDIIHNTIGVIAGAVAGNILFAIYSWVSKGWNRGTDTGRRKGSRK